MAKYDYNLIVIGGGSAGLIAALIGATVNARVALVEREKMGGDCLNTGCVPSKSLLRAARAAHEMRTADRFGIAGVEPEVDFAAVMARVQSVIATIEPKDSVERYTSLGVDCVVGDAVLEDGHHVRVSGVDGDGRWRAAPVRPGHRPGNRRGTLRAADSGLKGNRSADLGHGLGARGPAATIAGHGRRAHRLRAGSGLRPAGFRGHPYRYGRSPAAAGRPETSALLAANASGLKGSTCG